MRPLRHVPMIAVVTVVISACSFSFSVGGDSAEDASASAVEIIAELSDEDGLGVTETNCDAPADTDTGTTFDCISVTVSGAAITWVAELDGDEINVNSTNLITAGGLVSLLEALAGVVAEDTGVAYTAVDLDCGVAPIVLDSANEMPCELTLPSGELQALIVAIRDTTSGEFHVRVAE
jgi:hypothetical protein